jgi:hypothetical protein
MIVALVVHQYRARRPLMPVRQLATTFPVGGILVAMCASSAAFGLTKLILTALRGKSSPSHTALLFLPEFGAAVMTAVLFGALIGTSMITGIRVSAWICLVIAAGGTLMATTLFLLGGARLQAPDLERWDEGEPAWTSPPLLSRLRRNPVLPVREAPGNRPSPVWQPTGPGKAAE